LAFIENQTSPAPHNEGTMMTRATVFAGVLFALIGAPMAAHAQSNGVPGGAAHGFHEGNRIAGPVGAVVGTAVGGVIGGVEGVLGINQRPVAYPYDEAPPPAVRHRGYRKKYSHRIRHRHHRARAGYVSR